MTITNDNNILEMKNITKVYSNGFMANEQVNFSVRKGEIHAICGENGAGKSTLMKILFGEETPTEGEIYYKGEKIEVENPLSALDMGIGMVHQHFMLVPSLTVAENMVLGSEPTKGLFYDNENAIRVTNETSKKYNLPINPTDKVSDLPVGFRQRLEILKILYRGVDVLILDEPTAVLTPQETTELFKELLKLKEQGFTIIFISHKLNEVKHLCDRATILKNGKSIDVVNVKDVSESDISKLMVGRDVKLLIEKETAKPKESLLEVKNLTSHNREGKAVLNNVSFKLRRGEILGVVGIEGNGQRELSEIITGLSDNFEGKVSFIGQDLAGKNIRETRELGIAHISEDRTTYGLSLETSIENNMISDRYYKDGYSNKGLLNGKYIADESTRLIKEFQVKADGKDDLVKTLSGGNMQKVVVAREYSSNPLLLIANQPTRGVDVGSNEFIRNLIVDLRDKNAGVLLISADLTEALNVSDSIIIMYEGEIIAYFEDSSKITEQEAGEYMLGLKQQSAEKIAEVLHENSN